jgi:DNA-binding response OmpR family regulator
MSKSLDSPVKILLADDSVTMHRAVSLALKKESYELTCVDNGKDALRLAYEMRPQIILLDLDMPEKTGIEVAQDIRADATLAGTQIILLCGSFDEINEKDIEKAPVDARLWKPFESHVLLAMLRTLVSARAPSLASKSAPTAGAESTAPQTARPSLASPPRKSIVPPPPPPPLKSRKEEAIESVSLDLEDRAAKLPDDSTEQRHIQESVEATRPLSRSVADLFDPAKRPPVPDLATMNVDESGDFTRELARETFGGQPFPEELPEPQQAAEPTAPPLPPRGASPKEDPFVNNLWSPEELSSFDEETSFANSEENSVTVDTHSEETAYPEIGAPSSDTATSDLDFEVLDPHHISEATTSAHQSDPTSAPWMAQELASPLEDLATSATREIHSTLRERVSETRSSASGDAAPSATPEDLRRVVAEEVKRAFHGWLRDELQRQLNDVMSELDNELS